MSMLRSDTKEIEEFDNNLVNNLENDKLYKKFFNKKKNLSDASKKLYRIILKDYSYAIKMLPSEFIKEAKEEQMPFIKETTSSSGEVIKRIIEPDMESSNLEQHFNDYYDYMVNKNLVEKTRNHRFRVLKGFYREMGVKNLPNIEKEAEQKNKVSVLRPRQIKNAILKSKTRNQSIITLAVSTGFRGYDLRHFQVKDGLKALGIRSINELKKLNWEKVDIVGYWEFIPNKTKRSGLVCQGCNTPEASRYMVKYLQERIENGEELTLDSPLFATRSGFISEARFVRIFTNLDELVRQDEIAILKSEYENGNITEEEYEAEKDDIPYFHNHGLRKYFISVLATKCPNLRVAVKLEAHKSPINTDVNYVGVTEKEIKEEYIKLIPFLSFDNTEVNVLTDERIREYEKVIEELKESHQKEIEELKQNQEEKDKIHQKEIEELKNNQIEEFKLINKKIDTANYQKSFNPKIRTTISDFIRKELDIDNPTTDYTLKDGVTLEIVSYDIAMKNPQDFNDSPKYLNELIKKARLQYALYPEKYQEAIDNQYQLIKSENLDEYDIYNKLISKFREINVLDIFENISGDELDEMIWNYIEDNKKYLNNQIITDDYINYMVEEILSPL